MKKGAGMKSVHKSGDNKRLSLVLEFDQNIILHRNFLSKEQEPFSILRTVICKEFIEDLMKIGNIFGARYPIECIKMFTGKGKDKK